MRNTLYTLLFMGVSANALADFIYDPVCPLAEDAAMIVMAERQDGVSKSDYQQVINKTIKDKEGVFSPLFIENQRASINLLIEAAYKIPIFEDEKDKLRAIEEFGLFGYEACVEEANKEINERYPENVI